MPAPSVLCIGGCVIDRVGETLDAKERLYTSNIGVMRASIGGVARNVAENLARLGTRVAMASRLGDDAEGRDVMQASREAGVEMSRVTVDSTRRTASYTAVFNGAGELVIGLADMAIFDAITPAEARDWVAGAPALCQLFVDANLTPETLQAIAASKNGRLLAAGPVSQQKILRLKESFTALDILFLNRFEAAAILGTSIEGFPALARALHATGIRQGLLTAGAEDGLAWSGERIERIETPQANPVNVNGAGDALIAATLARIGQGDDFFQAARIGMAAAALTVETETTVRQDIGMANVLSRFEQARAGRPGTPLVPHIQANP
jgi:pseudouridine kinase